MEDPDIKHVMTAIKVTQNVQNAASGFQNMFSGKKPGSGGIQNVFGGKNAGSALHSKSTDKPCWFNCGSKEKSEPEVSGNQGAIEAIIPDPPYMTLWQKSKFEALRTDYARRIEHHPDFSVPGMQVRWQTTLLDDVSEPPASFSL